MNVSLLFLSCASCASLLIPLLVLRFINARLRDGAHHSHYQIVGKPPAQQVVEEALGFGARLRATAQARAALNRLLYKLFFGRLFKDLSDGFVRRLAVNLLERQRALQSPATDRLLPHLKGCVAEGVLLVVQVTVLAELQ